MDIGQLTTGGDDQDKMVLEMIVVKIIASIVNMFGIGRACIVLAQDIGCSPELHVGVS